MHRTLGARNHELEQLGEGNVPASTAPIEGEIKAGFGTKLISRVLSYDLVGTAGFDFDRGGFRCTLTFPIPPLGANAIRPLSAVETARAD